jgi:membrane protease YdiL (CAAX protease family)
MKTLENLISFLKSPYKANVYDDIKFKDFISLLILTIAFVVPYAILLEWSGIDQFDHKLTELLENNKWLVAVLAIFLAPLLEEPVYRLHLDLKKSHIAWSLGLSLLLISEVWYPLGIFWVYLVYLIVMINLNKKVNLKFVVYFSSAMFALIHMANFTDFDYEKYFFLVPILVSSQFIGGLILSYIRLNHGMKWAIVFHGVYNAMVVIPAVYFYEPI